MSLTEHTANLIPIPRSDPRQRGYSRASLILISLVVLALSAIVILLVTSGRLRTALRIAPGFKPHTLNKMVYYEPGAEVYADRISQFYTEAISTIEAKQLRQFTVLPRIYICSSEASFASRIDQSARIPVRGTAFARDIWLSPLIFHYYGEDTHRESILHELSHVHLTQQLGWLNRAGNVPGWFMEGLADWVAGMCSDEFSRREAIRAIRGGYTFLPDETGRLPFPKFPTDYGLPGPMLHKQSRLFLDYLQSQNPATMDSLLSTLYQEASFADAFSQATSQNLAESWNAFIWTVNNDSLSHIMAYPGN